MWHSFHLATIVAPALNSPLKIKYADEAEQLSCQNAPLIITRRKSRFRNTRTKLSHLGHTAVNLTVRLVLIILYKPVTR